MRIMFVFAAICAASVATAQQSTQPIRGPQRQVLVDGVGIALTIYNQSFAVARTSIDLDLHSGPNEVTTTNVTSMLEPDSVVLRDPSGKRIVRIVEQNYDAGVVDQSWLLSKYEGKTINFQISPGQIVQGKIIRAGFQRPYAYPYSNPYPNGVQSQPLVEVNGQMQFSLPGMPLFPAATDGLLLKPTLRWQIQSENDARFAAELAYITGGLDWEATYNIVAPDNPDVTTTEKADFLGWVTIHNESGTDFPSACIKLMAGDVAKIRQQAGYGGGTYRFADQLAVSAAAAPQVTQKAFDDFHLYDLNRTVSLANGEIKQVQFIEVAGIELRRSYIYDGASMQIQPIYPGNINEQRGYGLDPENHKVLVVQEIKNSEANHLGMPLPAGRIRLYRRDTDGQIEFTGESTIPHTPAEETLRIPTGGAFDIRGTRRQTDFHVNQSERTLDENFEIKLTNQKSQPVTVNVLEHLYRCDNWDITQKSSDYTKRDSHTIEFPIQIPAKGDATLTYAVHYTW